VSDTLLVNAMASAIGGQVGLGEGVAAVRSWLIGEGVALGALAALTALNWKAAPAIPPRVIPTTVTETLVIFMIDRTTRHHREPVRS
jgi:hypothetical protein